MPEQKIYGPLELPSGRKIEFRAPLAGDRAKVLQMINVTVDNFAAAALLVDEYLALKCITRVDGAPVSGDYKYLASDWPDQDIMYYKLVFLEMFGVTEKVQARAKEAARFLLSGQTFTDGCSSLDSVRSPGQNG